MPDRSTVSVHLLPALIPPGALKGGVTVVLDVLRATSVMVQALASGCEAIIPCLEIEEARGVAAGLPAGTAILGGERQGLPIEGFDFGNSPGSYTKAACNGKTLVMTTTNGTKAIHASLEASRVFVAAFTNLSATVSALPGDRAIHIVCSGTDGRISFEDSLLAGYLASALTASGVDLANDEAEIALRAAEFVEEKVGVWDLGQTLAAGRGGRRVRLIGLAGDIRDAAAIDRFAFSAELLRDPLRIVRFP